MEKERTIKELIEECIFYLRKERFSENYILYYSRLWKSGVIKYMGQNSIVSYNEKVGNDFAHEITTDTMIRKQRDMIRSVRILTDFLTTGTIRMFVKTAYEYELAGEIGTVAKEFIQIQITEKRIKRGTIRRHQRNLDFFIKHVSGISTNKISAITDGNILSFVSSSANCTSEVFNTMRGFLRYLHEQGYKEKDMSYVLGKGYRKVQEKLPSVYTPSEISIIENSIDQSSVRGKRNYAMLLLATRLGLRASDIAEIQFSNLDWDRNLIRLIQYKTKREIELPLLSDIGEAIINYLKGGRPIVDSRRIFLTAFAPYRPIEGVTVKSTISTIITNSDINIHNRKHGSHSMRHSLASQLLTNGASLSVIAESLGHSSTHSTMDYLRISIAKLMQCSLDVPEVSVEFYEQKGGFFYE
jgi:site-specific recombinase XerD